MFTPPLAVNYITTLGAEALPGASIASLCGWIAPLCGTAFPPTAQSDLHKVSAKACISAVTSTLVGLLVSPSFVLHPYAKLLLKSWVC